MGNDLSAGKVALVTGASRGIGAAIAKELAARGCQVAINYHNSDGDARRVAEEITAAGGRAAPFQGDVTDIDQVNAMVAKVAADLGAPEILVLNAPGFTGEVRGSTMGLSPELLLHGMSSQVRASLLPVYAAVPGMVELGHGSVVFISDPFARHPRAGAIGHALASASIEVAAKTLALELGPQGIRVNAVIPGVTRTEASLSWMKQEGLDAMAARLPLQRVGEPEDVARAVALLVSPDLDYVTGCFIPVAGGGVIF
ncbi:SDR family oxidoreductase [Nocardia sp. NPDC046473]|uniref:SDR family NAD(P)-dependent oxidoreductase n=1 Tax=Nocardia sp. NPDC046473 TaxID=3155733 RepID=UPI0033F9DD32